jgi:hypothetical protein
MVGDWDKSRFVSAIQRLCVHRFPDRQRLEIRAGFTLLIHVKRQMTAALQDAQRSPVAPEPRESVLDCASPLALWGNVARLTFVIAL